MCGVCVLVSVCLYVRVYVRACMCAWVGECAFVDTIKTRLSRFEL